MSFGLQTKKKFVHSIFAQKLGRSQFCMGLIKDLLHRIQHYHLIKICILFIIFTSTIQVPNEIGSLDPLRGYQGEDIEIQLPGNLTVYDIDWLAVWCVKYRHNFGHVYIPKDLDVPPALGQTKIAVSHMIFFYFCFMQRIKRKIFHLSCNRIATMVV